MLREYRIRKLKQQLSAAKARKAEMDALFKRTTTIDGGSMQQLFDTAALIGEIEEKISQLEKPHPKTGL